LQRVKYMSKMRINIRILPKPCLDYPN